MVGANRTNERGWMAPWRALASWGESARPGGYVCLSVTDTGCGMEERILRRLFEPFITTKPEGMGMGLSIARTIIEAHGGQLSAENEAGHGATLRISLPIAASHN